MSTILKALKKSAADRQLGQTPRLSDLPQTGHGIPASPRGQRVLIVLLAGLGLAMAGYLLWPEAPVRKPEPTSQRVTQATLPEATGGETPGPRQTEATSQPPATGPEPKTSGSSRETLPAPGVVESEQPAPATVEPGAVPAPDSREPQPAPLPEYALLPRYRDLPRARRESLPPLTLNVLIYAEQPARRFVMINLDRYAQGDTITGSLRVVEIIAEGVVLEDGKGRFVLPRP